MADGLATDMLMFLAATFLGAVVAGTAGFAFGLVVSSLWLHVISPSQSTPLIAAYAIVIQAMSLWAVRKSIDVRRIAPLIAGSILGIPLGVGILTWASATHMRALIGAVLVAFSLYSLTRPQRLAARTTPLAEAVVGLISGVLGGSTGLGGIAIIIWSAICGWSKEQQRAIFQPVTIAILSLSLAWMAMTGVLTAATIKLFFIGLPVVMIGTWLGLQLYGRLNEAAFRVGILVLLLLSGTSLLWSTYVVTGR